MGALRLKTAWNLHFAGLHDCIANSLIPFPFVRAPIKMLTGRSSQKLNKHEYQEKHPGVKYFGAFFILIVCKYKLIGLKIVHQKISASTIFSNNGNLQNIKKKHKKER